MSKKKFKAESKQLLELMIHSIYSNKDVFIRELISNSSDALDKRHFSSLTNEQYKYEKLEISIEIDQDKRTLSIIDNGIGMNKRELDDNLGTIANSGTKKFMESIKSNDEKINLETIGQFGVGFYASFIVANKVEVTTKKPNDIGYIWTSDGIENYSIEESPVETNGTKITLFLREDQEFDHLLQSNEIQTLIKKYSNYIKYPIKMEIDNQIDKLDEEGNPIEGEFETVQEIQVINSQKAIWKKKKQNIKKEEYNDFYKNNYFDIQDPLFTFHAQVEGKQNYDLLIYIPAEKEMDFYVPDYQKGLDLYSKGVLIEKNVDYLLDDSFGFIRGLVDSSDLNLNISREMLQKDETVTKLKELIEARIKKDLLKKLKKDREKYNQFFTKYGPQLIYGIYNNYGSKKELFQDLVQFKTSKNHEYVTLNEYIENNPENKFIYYVSGKSIEDINKMPIMEKISDSNDEILYFTNDIDEFAIQVLNNYKDKTFKSITEEDFSSDEEKDEINNQTKDNQEFLDKASKIVDGIKEVKLTNKLTTTAFTLKADGPVSLEMEKVLLKNPDSGYQKTDKILELNVNHDLFTTLKEIEDQDKLKLSLTTIYNMALISEGLDPINPIDLKENIVNLIINNK